MKKRLIHGCCYIGVFFALILTLWMLLAASAALIPNEAIRPNAMRSAEFYMSQKSPRVLMDDERGYSTIDYYGDVVWMHLAWNMGKADNPFVSTLDTWYYDVQGLGENAAFYLALTEEVEANMDYSRYWHGTAMALRLLLLFTDVNGITLIGFAVMLLLIVLTCVYLIRKKHLDIAVLMVLSLLAVQIWYVSLNVHYQPAFMITFLLCPFYIWLEQKGNWPLVLLSVIGGTLVAFFDFLTTETTTILLPLMLVIAIRAKEGRLGTLRENLPWLFCCGLAWLLSYFGTFAVKWAMLSVLRGENFFAQALESAAVHFSVESDTTEQPAFFSSVTANLSVLFGGSVRMEYIRSLIGVVVSVLALVLIWRFSPAPSQKEKSAAALLLLLGAIVFVRFLILNSHSIDHDIFTYRALCSTIFAMFTALWLNIGLGKRRKERTRKG